MRMDDRDRLHRGLLYIHHIPGGLAGVKFACENENWAFPGASWPQGGHWTPA